MAHVFTFTNDKGGCGKTTGAWNWHGMFDQLTKTVDAITTARHRNYRFQNTEFRFLRVEEKLFGAFMEVRVDEIIANIGEIEKVILDYLFLRRNVATLSLVVEKLREYQRKFDFAKMIDFAKTYSLTLPKGLHYWSLRFHFVVFSNKCVGLPKLENISQNISLIYIDSG
jgi:hypothetical protein